MNYPALALTAGAALMAISTVHAADGKFTVSSPDLQPGKPVANTFVLNDFGCSGENKSPRIEWRNAPAGTKSFVLTVLDPDAPTGSGWWHWVVLDIPASASGLPGAIGQGGSLPAGAREGRTDLGKPGYTGPCPPAGDKPHRYVFTLHALKVDELDVPAEATAAFVGLMTSGNRIGQASFTVRHGR